MNDDFALRKADEAGTGGTDGLKTRGDDAGGPASADGSAAGSPGAVEGDSINADGAGRDGGDEPDSPGSGGDGAAEAEEFDSSDAGRDGPADAAGADPDEADRTESPGGRESASSGGDGAAGMEEFDSPDGGGDGLADAAGADPNGASDDETPSGGAETKKGETPPLFDAPSIEEQERMVEAILFATAEPMTVAQMESRMPQGSDPAEAVVRLRGRYEDRGVRVVRVGDAWAIRTAPDLGYLMRRETVEQRKLSRAATETLAIIAYHQPCTRAEIEEIRGVSVSRGTIDLLLELDWVKFGRRRMTPGRPVTYTVTSHFLDHFGLEGARDLPGLKELRAAGLLESGPPPEGSDPDGEENGENEDGDIEEVDQDELFEELDE